MKRKSLLSNQDGILTIDFIFALVLVGGFFSVLFSLAVTLSVIEVTQYITFATARNYYAGHWDLDNQTAAGAQKYQDLTEDNEVFKPLFSNGWFELETNTEGGIADWNDKYSDNGEDSANFIGSRVQLNAKVLEIRVPIFGDTFEDTDAFTANVASYLNREPTSIECINFMREENRFQAIQGLDPSYGAASFGNYKVIADNGC